MLLPSLPTTMKCSLPPLRKASGVVEVRPPATFSHPIQPERGLHVLRYIRSPPPQTVNHTLYPSLPR
ncbi:MAG: hypothetical protein QXK88_08195 [Desulfurococcaceae archaeon]